MTWERITIPDSSNVAEIAYESTSSTLEVKFHNGGVYQYYDVPEHVWDSFQMADSKGKFLHAQIKGNYRYSKV